MEVVALLGSILLAICSLPLAWEAIRYPQTAQSISGPFLHTWMLGEVLTAVYVVHQGYWVLLINYAVNLLGLAVVYYYRYISGRNTREQYTREISLRHSETDAGGTADHTGEGMG